jgi:predicted nucleic acid-binding protein
MLAGSGSLPVFLDSSGYLALVSARDLHHQEARIAWTRLTDEHWRTFTTNFVVAETHALFLARLSWAHAAAFLRQFASSTTTVIRVEAADEQRASAIIFQYEDKAWSFTDATSFAVMERLKIVHALTFDRDFSQYGFAPIVIRQQ